MGEGWKEAMVYQDIMNPGGYWEALGKLSPCHFRDFCLYLQ